MTDKTTDTAEAVYFPWDPECQGSILNQPVNPDELIVSYSLYVEFYCRATTEMAVQLIKAALDGAPIECDIGDGMATFSTEDEETAKKYGLIRTVIGEDDCLDTLTQDIWDEKDWTPVDEAGTPPVDEAGAAVNQGTLEELREFKGSWGAWYERQGHDLSRDKSQEANAAPVGLGGAGRRTPHDA